MVARIERRRLQMADEPAVNSFTRKLVETYESTTHRTFSQVIEITRNNKAKEGDCYE